MVGLFGSSAAACPTAKKNVPTTLSLSGVIPRGNKDPFVAGMPFSSWLMNASINFPSAFVVILVFTFLGIGQTVSLRRSVASHLGGWMVNVVRLTQPGTGQTCFAVVLKLGLSIATECSLNLS